jgi:hypothetical protein
MSIDRYLTGRERRALYLQRGESYKVVTDPGGCIALYWRETRGDDDWHRVPIDPDHLWRVLEDDER